MKPETLTEMERLQLANQYAMLEKLDAENAEHWAEWKEILQTRLQLILQQDFRSDLGGTKWRRLSIRF